MISLLSKANVSIFDFTQYMRGLLLKKTFQRNEKLNLHLRIYAVKDEKNDEMKYLDVSREKILSKCNCGGLAIITTEDEDSLNQTEYPNPNKGHDGLKFLLSQAHEDELEKNVFFHNSILISKNLKNENHSFVNGTEKMCRMFHTESGTRLNTRLFI